MCYGEAVREVEVTVSEIKKIYRVRFQHLLFYVNGPLFSHNQHIALKKMMVTMGVHCLVLVDVIKFTQI